MYMQSEKLKTAATYAFRLSPEDKAWLESELAKLKDLVNKKRAEGTKVILKNDILLEALRIGFKAIKQK